MEMTISSEKKLYGEEGLVNLLRQHFGHSEFRGKQLEAIEAVLSGLTVLFWNSDLKIGT